MSVILFAKAWVATTIAFLLVDGLWLGIVAKNFYREQLGFLMKDSVNFPAAAGFYLLYSAAVVYLASMPGFRESSAMTALMSGAVFGLAAYGTYDMTNLATLKNWPIAMSIVDMVWGTVLTSFVAYVGFRALQFFS